MLYFQFVYFPIVFWKSRTLTEDDADIILERHPDEECSGASFVYALHKAVLTKTSMRTTKAPTTNDKVDRGLYQRHLPAQPPFSLKNNWEVGKITI